MKTELQAGREGNKKAARAMIYRWAISVSLLCKVNDHSEKDGQNRPD